MILSPEVDARHLLAEAISGDIFVLLLGFWVPKSAVLHRYSDFCAKRASFSGVALDKARCVVLKYIS